MVKIKCALRYADSIGRCSIEVADNDTIDSVCTSVLNEPRSRAVFPDHIKEHHLCVYEVDQKKEISVATFDEYGENLPLDSDDPIGILNKDFAKPIFAIGVLKSIAQVAPVAPALRSLSNAVLQSQMRRIIQESKKPTGTTTYAELGKSHFDPKSQLDGGHDLITDVDTILGSDVLPLPTGFSDWDSFFGGAPQIDVTRDWPEKDVQKWFLNVLEYFKKHVHCGFHFLDTSHTPLHQSTDKHDITVTQDIFTISYANVVTVMELKSSLKASSDVYVALGQVVERCRNIFNHQPPRRHVIAAVVGVSSCEICFLDKDYVREKRTGLLSFGRPHYSGFMSILKLMTRSASQIGLSLPALPDSFRRAYPTIVFQTVLFHSSHTMVVSAYDPSLVSSASSNTASHTASSCSSTFSQIANASSQNANSITPNCVIKFSSKDGLKNEAEQLNLLRRCQFVPRLIHAQFELDPFIQTSPLGNHLCETDSVALICQVLADVCCALVFAWKECHQLLHRDVSYGNIIVYDGRGFLIDWHVASNHQNEKSVKLTGTQLYSSPFLSVKPPHPHSLIDDLVSVYFVFLYVGLRHDLPWAEVIQLDSNAARIWKESCIQNSSAFRTMMNSVPVDLVVIVGQFRAIIEKFIPLYSTDNPARNATVTAGLECAQELIRLLTGLSDANVATVQTNSRKRKVAVSQPTAFKKANQS